jgi:hypothetical protein
MERSLFWATSLLAAGAASTTSAQTSNAAPPILYRYVQVSAPPGYDLIKLTSINNHGEAAGTAWKRRNSVWDVVIRSADGTINFLPDPPGCNKHDYLAVVDINDSRQLVLDTRACNDAPSPAMFWGERSGWTPIEVPGTYEVRVVGMNDLGDVAGTANPDAPRGFIWTPRGNAEVVSLEDGLRPAGINNRRHLAATVQHVARDDGPRFDTDGQSAALLRLNHDPVYTGDKVIQTLDRRQDPRAAGYEITSTAAGLNESDAIAITSLGSDSYRSFACVWRRKQPMACAKDFPGSSKALGIGGRNELIVSTDRDEPMSYLFLPDQHVTYSFNSVAEPSPTRELTVRSISEAGYIAGYPWQTSDSSFVLIPIEQAWQDIGLPLKVRTRR